MSASLGSIGKRQIPELESGKASIFVMAVRPVLFGLREVQSTASREIEVRLIPPQIAVQSTHHYINHGGSELIVIESLRPMLASGVRVGDLEYPGFPASGAGIDNADPACAWLFSRCYGIKNETRRSIYLPAMISATKAALHSIIACFSKGVPQEPHRG